MSENHDMSKQDPHYKQQIEAAVRHAKLKGLWGFNLPGRAVGTGITYLRWVIPVEPPPAKETAMIETTLWQPIETAPKDARRILAYEDGQIYICSRTVGYDWWESEHEDKGSGKPTHWMPLPDPPSEA